MGEQSPIHILFIAAFKVLAKMNVKNITKDIFMHGVQQSYLLHSLILYFFIVFVPLFCSPLNWSMITPKQRHKYSYVVTDIRSAICTYDSMTNTFHEQLSKQFETEYMRFALKRVRHNVARASPLLFAVRFANVAQLREVSQCVQSNREQKKLTFARTAYFPRHVNCHLHQQV